MEKQLTDPHLCQSICDGSDGPGSIRWCHSGRPHNSWPSGWFSMGFWPCSSCVTTTDADQPWCQHRLPSKGTMLWKWMSEQHRWVWLWLIGGCEWGRCCCVAGWLADDNFITYSKRGSPIWRRWAADRSRCMRPFATPCTVPHSAKRSTAWIWSATNGQFNPKLVNHFSFPSSSSYSTPISRPLLLPVWLSPPALAAHPPPLPGTAHLCRWSSAHWFRSRVVSSS